MKVVITDYYYKNLDHEKEILGGIEGLTLEPHHCKEEDAVCELVRDADAVIVQFAPITKKVIDAMEHCKVIVRYAIGVDNIDLDAATAKGIYVANVPDYSIDEVSNQAIALLFAVAKKLVLQDRRVHAGVWDYGESKPLYRLSGKTLGLIGFGRIPRMVAEKLRAFGLHILCYDPFVAPEDAAALGAEKVELDELLKRSDYVSVHCPLTEQTRHLLGAREFQLMKPTAVVINTARGSVIDEADLAAALQAGEISGAGLDVLETEPPVPDNPLLKMENVVITPHNAWYSEEAIESLQCKVAEEVARVLRGEVPRNLVNRAVLKK